jgi:hypothetical protein
MPACGAGAAAISELHSPPVPLGPDNPTWKKLYGALAKLAAESGGSFAFVIDRGNCLWCVGLANSGPTTVTMPEDRAADRFYETEMVPRLAAIRRGTPFDVAKTVGKDRYLAASFAGIYAVVVWFSAPFNPALIRARIRRALPEIEALTLALPPSDGPGFDEGAQRVRA